MRSSEFHITIPYIEGDGIGPEIMRAAIKVLDAAVAKSYGSNRSIHWQETFAGKKALKKTSNPLPHETLELIKTKKIALKGPLTTPVGEGYSSLNVMLRQALDLYVCLRPIRWMKGLPSPNSNARHLDVVVFRENSEDIYCGIEFQAGSDKNARFLSSLSRNFPEEYARIPFKNEVGITLKPISKQACQRIMRAAIQWAIDHQRKKITLVHKGNIMKYTEGAFMQWAYNLAENEFPLNCYTQQRFKPALHQYKKSHVEQVKPEASAQGKILVNDVIADVAFEQAILQPQSFDVVVTTNLNGDYLSDAFAALVGGVGISPSGNINFEQEMAMFEANHGSADEIADQNKANPSSLILSGAMMLEFLGWSESAVLIRKALESAIQRKLVTFDLARLVKGSTVLGTAEFGQAIIDSMD